MTKIVLIPTKLKYLLEKHSGYYMPIADELEKMVKNKTIFRYTIWTYAIFIYDKDGGDAFLIPQKRRQLFGRSKVICKNWRNGVNNTFFG